MRVILYKTILVEYAQGQPMDARSTGYPAWAEASMIHRLRKVCEEKMVFNNNSTLSAGFARFDYYGKDTIAFVGQYVPPSMNELRREFVIIIDFDSLAKSYEKSLVKLVSDLVCWTGQRGPDAVGLRKPRSLMDYSVTPAVARPIIPDPLTRWEELTGPKRNELIDLTPYIKQALGWSYTMHRWLQTGTLMLFALIVSWVLIAHFGLPPLVRSSAKSTLDPDPQLKEAVATLASIQAHLNNVQSALNKMKDAEQRVQFSKETLDQLKTAQNNLNTGLANVATAINEFKASYSTVIKEGLGHVRVELGPQTFEKLSTALEGLKSEMTNLNQALKDIKNIHEKGIKIIPPKPDTQSNTKPSSQPNN